MPLAQTNSVDGLLPPLLCPPFLGEARPEYLQKPRLHQQFAALAAAHPERPCVITEDGQHSYGEVDAAACNLASRLAAAGIRHQDYVGVVLPRSFELVVSVLAIWKAGAVYVPMDPEFPADRLAVYVEDSRASLILAVSATEAKVRALVEQVKEANKAGNKAANTAAVWLLDRPKQDEQVKAGPGPQNSQQDDRAAALDQLPASSNGISSSSNGSQQNSDVAYCIFTSGSTGRPKGVQVLHIGLIDFVAYYNKKLEADASLRTLMISSISFDAHCLDLSVALTCGGALVMPKPGGHLEPAYIVDTLQRQAVNTILMSVPSLVREYMAVMDQPYAGMRVWLMGGEAMPLPLANQMLQNLPNVKLYNIYGPTEATICCTNFLMPRPSTMAPIGAADDNMHAMIVDPDTKQLAPLGQPGELLLSGPRLAGGYCNRPDLTTAAFVANPFYEEVAPTLPANLRPFYKLAYRTGDLVSFSSDGLISYLGRIDRQVKVNGVRIELGEVEAALQAAPGVRGAVAKVLKDSNGRAMLAGYCLMPDDAKAAVRDHCKRVLLPAMVPAILIAMDAFPLLPNGKTDVRALPEPDWSSIAAGEEYAAPETPMEAEVQAMWQQVLQFDSPISVEAEWAAVGGTSLKAIVLYQMLKKHYALPGPSAALAAASTVRGQAAAVAAMRADSGAEAAALAPIAWSNELRPLSAGQLQMYILSEQIALHYLYNESYAQTLEGPLRVDLIEPAAAAIVDRHEVLRCSYEQDSQGNVISRVLPLSDARPPFAQVDLSGLGAAEAESRWQQLMEDHHKAPFDMRRPPLMRVLLAQLPGKQRYKLLFTIHHGVMDGISMGLIAMAFQQAYAALVAAAAQNKQLQQPRDALPPLPLQYGDYAAWQTSFLASADAKRQLQWWTGNLAGAPQLLTLPLDRPRPAVRSHKGDIFGVFLPPDLGRGVEQLMARCGATLVNVSLAAYRLMLALYAGQSDLVIGVPQSTREPGTEQLIGYFLNMIPIRGQVELAATPRQLLKAEQTAMQGAIAHSGVPFHEIVEALGVARSSSYNPLLQATLTFDDDSWFPEMHLAGGVKGRDVTGSGFGFETFVSKSDITLCVVRGAGENGAPMIYNEFEYNTDIFDKSTMERMMHTYTAILQAMCQSPDSILSGLPLVSGHDRSCLLGPGWFDLRPELAAGPSVVAVFEAQAARSPGARCLVHEGASMTYGQVNASANALAQRLAAAGVGRDVPVGLYLERGFPLVVAMLAVLKAGGCYVPLDPSYPADRLKIYVEDSAAAAILCAPEHEAAARAMAAASPAQPQVLLVAPDVLAVDASAWSGGFKGHGPAGPASLDSLAYIIFTSGSTGRPKGAKLHHRGLAELCAKYNEVYGVGPSSVTLLVTSISFDPHVFVIFGPLVAGATLVLPHQTGHLDPELLGSLMLQHKVDTIMSWVPSAVQGFLGVPAFKQALHKLRWLGLGGESLPLPLVAQLQAVMAQRQGVVNLYGPTEATCNSNLWVVPAGCPGPMVIGHPCANFLQYVVDPVSLVLLPVGAPGELLLSGPRVGYGYIGRDDLTRERFIDNPFRDQLPGEVPASLRPFYQRAYRTGDLVRWTAEGQLEFLGRIDRQVKVNGVRIELGEVEAALQAAPGVELAAAKVFKDAASGSATLVGFAQTAPDNVAAVLAHCRAVLVPAMVPSVIVAVEQFAMLPNGKLDYNRLPAVDLSGVGAAAGAAGGELVLPSSRLEQLVHDAWTAVLKADGPISVHSDFFRIGGNSLKAILAASHVKQALAMPQLSTPQLLQHSTIASMAAFLETVTGAAAGSGAADQAPALTAGSWQGPLRPPSAGQQQMYTLSTMDATGHLYNSSAAVQYNGGRVDPVVLQAALDVVLARHECLRSAFEQQLDGSLMMKVVEPRSELLPLKLVSLPDSSAAVDDYLSSALHVRLDLHVAPCGDAALLQLAGGRSSVLLLTFHHSVIDGWSAGLLLKELIACYNALLAASWPPAADLGAALRMAAPVLPSLAVKYADYAAWQQQRLASPEISRQLEQWKQQLSGVPELLQLPSDRPRPAVMSHRGDHFEFELPGEMVQQLHSFAAASGTTPFVTLLAAYRVLLARMTGQLDFVVGAAYQNRPTGTEQVVGYFVNTLPLRTPVGPGQSFAALVAAEQQTLRAAMAAGDVPFQDIVSALNVSRTAAYSPLVQAMMVFQDEGFVCNDCPTGVEVVKVVPAVGKISPMDVALSITPSAGGRLAGLCQFNTDIFEVSTMQQFVACFTHLLSQLLAEPHSPATSLSLLSPSQQSDLLLGELQCDLNPESVSSPNVLVQFEQQAVQQPAAPCVSFGGQQMSYAAVNAAANALARRLAGAGVGRHGSVGVLLPRSFELVVSVLAIWKAGAVYVPMDPGFPEERLAVYAEDSKAQVLLVQPGQVEKATALLAACNSSAKVLVLTDADAAAVPAAAAAGSNITQHLRTSSSDVAYCIFTSGSTGRPKGVCVPHIGLTDLTMFARKVFHTGPDVRVLQVISTSFDPHVVDIAATLTSGGCLVLPKPGGHTDPAYIAELIRQERVTHVLGCVASLSREYIAALGRYDGLLLWTMGGENMPVPLVNVMQQALPNVTVVNAYGPTEVSVMATCYACPRPCVGPMVIGRPNTNVHAYVVESGGSLTPRGTPGELLLSGPRLATGYFGRPDLTEKAFVMNPFYEEVAPCLPANLRPFFKRAYRTGDLVRWSAEGQLEFLGRIDRQVKVNGVRIELGEVEAALQAAPGVSAAVAKVVKDSSGRASLVGYCLVDADGTTAVQAHCRRVLLPAMVPSVIVAMNEFKRLPNGKIDTDNLPEPDWAALAAGEAYMAPTSELEQQLQQLWMDELQVSDPISVTADWYRLGGTSLKAIALSAKLKQRYTLPGSTAELLTLNTIAQQAEYLQQHMPSNDVAAGAAIAAEEELTIVPRTWPDEYRPASYGQQQMYVVSSEKDSSNYNQGSLYSIEGHLCLATLQRAVNSFAQRHEVLHAAYEFSAQHGTRIRVEEGVKVPLALEDISHLHKEEIPAALEQLVSTFQAQPFDLTHAPLMRVLAVKTGTLQQPSYALLFMLHHAVMDGWSMHLMAKEVSALYADFACGKPASLPPVTSLAYSDYAAWQLEYLAGPHALAKRSWWASNLSGVPELLQLPLDRPRPAKQSGNGALHTSLIPSAVAARLDALSKQLGCSLFHILLAAFKAVLMQYSGQSDLVIGSTFASRPPKTEGLMGYFLNILPIRSQISNSANFAELVSAERAAVLAAMAHSDIPFQDIVAAVGVKRTAAYLPLCNVMCTMEDEEWTQPLNLYGCKTDFAIYDPAQAKNDLVLGINPRADGIIIGITYSTDVLTNASVGRLAANLAAFVSAAAAQPHTPIGQLLGCLDAAERQLLLTRLQGHSHPEYCQEPLVAAAFEAAAAKHAKAPCVAFEGSSLTYGQVNAAANALARRLAGAGVGRHGSVGVLLPRSFELVVSVLAIWKAGAVYVPMDPGFPEERLAVYAEDSKAQVLLVQPGQVEKATALLAACNSSAKVLVLTDADAAAVPAAAAAGSNITQHLRTSSSDVAYCIFTSGSTGRPKGCQVSYGALRDLLGQYIPVFKAGPSMRALQVVSISFDPHVLDFTATLTSGGCLVLPKPGGQMDPAYIAELIRQERVTHVLTSVPSVSSQYLAALGSYDGMRLWLMGGENLPTSVACDMQKAFPFLVGPLNAYGPTEATICASHYICPRPCEGPMVIGPPDHNMHAYVVHPETRQLLPLGASGELLLSGPRLAAGYFGRPELTEKAFVVNPFYEEVAPGLPAALRPFYQRAYRTGDLVRWTAEGQLEFLGRIDRQVKVNGVRIELGEVEAALQAAPGVSAAVAKVVKDSSGRASLVGYCLVDADGTTAVQAHCRRVLLPAMVPSVIVAMSEFKRLPNGKIDTDNLPEPDWAALAAGDAYQGPRTKLQQQLQQLWMDELQIKEPISVTADWYRLGGTSLKAIALAAAIKDHFGLTGSTSDLILATTIEDQAKLLQDEVSDTDLDADMSVFVPAGRAAAAKQALMAVHWDDDTRPCSAGQEQMFVLSLDANGSHYNESNLYTIQGDLDLAVLQGALNAIVDRHEVLRGGFVAGKGGLRVRIAPKGLVVPLTLHDLSGQLPEQAAAAADAWLREGKDAPFEMTKPPLMRALVVKLPPAAAKDNAAGQPVWKLLLVLHHAVMDGMSMGVLAREVDALYNGVSLPPLPLQYADWAHWQKQFLGSEDFAQQLAWWKQTLEGVPELLALPTDRPRPQQQTFRGSSLEFTLKGDMVKAVHALNAATSSSFYNTCLTAFKVVLALYSGDADIVVGSSYASRPKGTEDLIGYMLNMLAIRTCIDLQSSFKQLLRAERTALLSAIAHADVPFQVVVSELGLKRSSAYTPLIQAMMTTDDMDWFPELKLSGCRPAKCEALHTDETKSDIVLGVIPNGSDEIWVGFQYSSDLFEPATIRAMADTFTAVLTVAAAAPDTAMCELPLVAGPQRNRLLLEVQGKSCPEFLTAPLVHQAVESHAAEQPSAPCLAFERASMNYAQVNAAANDLAGKLVAAGIKPGDRVGVFLQRGLHLPIAMLAVLKAGGCYVPMDPHYPQDRLQQYAEAAGVSVILAQPQLLSRGQALAAGSRAQVMPYSNEDALAAGSSRASNLGLSLDRGSGAYIIFTSGSTGTPKGVLLSHRAMVDFVQDWVATTHLGPSDVGVLFSTISFDAHLLQLWPLLVAGSKCVVPKDEGHMDTLYVAELMAHHKVTVNLFCAPRLSLEWLRRQEMKVNASRVRLWASGGELVPNAMLEKVFEVFPSMPQNLVLYGPTETAVTATSFLVNKASPRGLLGRPNSNTHCYVANPSSLGLVPPGAPGELLISGPCLATGYFGRPDLTDKAFVANPFYEEVAPGLPASLRPFYQRAYRTGDLVRWTAEGQLEFLGRIDRQVKVNGVRIELGEVEAALQAAPGVTDVVVLGREISPGNKQLVAFVTPSTVDPAAAMAACSAKLLPAMRPARIVALDDFPHMPNGKVNQAALLASPALLEAPITNNRMLTRVLSSNRHSKLGKQASLVRQGSLGRPQPSLEIVSVGLPSSGLSGGGVSLQLHGVGGSVSLAAPKDDVEGTVLGVWSQYLDLPGGGELGVDDNFWALGGTSLQAGLITSELQRLLGVSLQMATAFGDSTTVRSQAAHIKALTVPKRAAPPLLKSISLVTSLKPASKDAQQQPTLGELISSAKRAAKRFRFNIPARTISGLGEKLYAIGTASWSYGFYALVQYVLSTIMWFVVPGCFSVTGLALIIGLAKINVSGYIGFPMLMAVYPVVLLLATFLLLVIKWVLVGRLSPGAYPVHSWTYARWVTLHALQDQIFPLLAPFIARTSAANWLLRLLGARVGRGVLLDSLSCYDFDLLELGDNATLDKGASMRASFVVPADPEGRGAVLVLTHTSMGDSSKLGVFANMPAGTHLPDGHSVRPAMTAGQEGAIEEGSLPLNPHFLPERHQGWFGCLSASLLVMLVHSVGMALGIAFAVAAGLSAVGLLSRNPIPGTDAGPFAALLRASTSSSTTMIAFSAVLVFTSFKVTAVTMSIITFLAAVVWKNLVLGSLKPGTNVLRSSWKLWAYCVWRRLLALPGMEVWSLLMGNTYMGLVSQRLLGGRHLGREVFSAGLGCSEPDALELGDFMSSGGRSHASCVDAEGVVRSVKVGKGTTLGNMSLLFPGSKVGDLCIIGSSTCINQDEEVGAAERRQGRARLGTVHFKQQHQLRQLQPQLRMEHSLGTLDEEGGGASGAADDEAAAKQAMVEAVLAEAAPSEGLSHFGRGFFKFLGKFAFYNTQIEVQSFLLVCIWTKASEKLGWVVALATLPPLLVVCVIMSVLWCRLLQHVLGCRSIWLKQGTKGKPSTHSVWSIRTGMSTGVIAPMQSAIATPYLGTPILNVFLRLMGMKLGRHCIFLGAVPTEAPLFTLGHHVVVEAGGTAGGHFLASQRFTYIPVSLGDAAWIQSDATLHAGCTMQPGSRVLPGANVLPGQTLTAGSVWDGIPAMCVAEATKSIGL